MRYIDTSAFVNYYSDEKSESGSTKIVRLIDDAKTGKEKLLSSFFMIGEVLTIWQMMGGLIVVAGIYLVHFSRIRKRN